MSAERAKIASPDLKETKRVIAESFKQIRLIEDAYTGEVTISFNSGGVMFIRKSETLK